MLRSGSWNPASGEDLKVGRHSVRLKRSLGEGGFAFIHLVEDVQNGRVLVLKRSTLQSHEGRVVYEKESSIMRSLAHPNIVQFVTAVELPLSKAGAILMEYCPNGHLLEALNRLGGKRMKEEAVLCVMSDVVSAVKYLHDKGITHRDIKLENILRSSSGLHKLCDFGSCVHGRVSIETPEQRVNEEEVVEKTTTQMYRAPEMVDLYMERELTEKVDVWALGCVLFAVSFLKHPFQDAGNLGILNARIRIPEDAVYSGGLNELIRRLLTASPGRRLSASEVESCIQALSKGRPLPPVRYADPPETRGVHVVSPSENSAAGVPIPAASSSNKNGGAGGVSREGSYRDVDISAGGESKVVDGSGRRASMFVVKGKGSVQGTSPSSMTASSAAAKIKEPQLNPNSVAARRLASRKGSLSGTEARGGALSEQQQAGAFTAPSGLDHAAAARPDVSSCSSATVGQLAWQGSSSVRAPGVLGSMMVASGAMSDSAWPAAASQAGESVGVSRGGGVPEGWSNFATFENFPAKEVSAGGREGSFVSSFDAPAAADANAFGSAPMPSGSRGDFASKSAEHGSSSVTRGAAGQGSSNASRQESSAGPVSPLLDLGPSSSGGVGVVDALAGQLAGTSFPATCSPGEKSTTMPPGTVVDWGSLGGGGGVRHHAAWSDGGHGRGGQTGSIHRSSPFGRTEHQGSTPPQAGRTQGGQAMSFVGNHPPTPPPPPPPEFTRSSSLPSRDAALTNGNHCGDANMHTHPWGVGTPAAGQPPGSESRGIGPADERRSPSLAVGRAGFASTFPNAAAGGGRGNGWQQAMGVAGVAVLHGGTHQQLLQDATSGRVEGQQQVLGQVGGTSQVAGASASASPPPPRAGGASPVRRQDSPAAGGAQQARTLSPAEKTLLGGVRLSPSPPHQQRNPQQQWSPPQAGGQQVAQVPPSGWGGGVGNRSMTWGPGMIAGVDGVSPPVVPSPPLFAEELSGNNVRRLSGSRLAGSCNDNGGFVGASSGGLVSAGVTQSPGLQQQQQQQRQQQHPQQQGQAQNLTNNGGRPPPPPYPGGRLSWQ